MVFSSKKKSQTGSQDSELPKLGLSQHNYEAMDGTITRNTKNRFSTSPNVQYFGEQKESDVFYDVYLRRIHYSPLTQELEDLEIDNSETTTLAHRQWSTCKVLYLKSGTVAKIIDYIGPKQQEDDPTFVNVLLCTYKTFTKQEEMIDLVLKRYRQLTEDCKHDETRQDAEDSQKCLRTFFYAWIDQYPMDFNQHPDYPMLNKLIEFAQSDKNSEKLCDKLKLYREDFIIAQNGANVSSNGCPDDEVESDTSSSCGLTSQSYDFLTVPSINIAEQLTLVDAELFRNVQCYQCLGSIWAKRTKADRNELTESVTATVKQFNRVLFCVVTTILTYNADNTSPQLRGRIISKWIDIAHECRMLKNFSSSKAIITALKFSPIYRLKRSWQNVSREKLDIYDELSTLFSEENNQKLSREVLWKEGTAKFSEKIAGTPKKLSLRRRRKSKTDLSLAMQGTVPYLGTFLTDLTMLDTASPDRTEEKLVNFEKKRREFEIIAKVKLLQAAAKNYSILPDKEFSRWFKSIELLNEDESYCLSSDIEKDGCSRNKDRRSSVFSTVKNLFGGVNNIVDVELVPSDTVNGSYNNENLNTTSPTELRRVNSTASVASSSSNDSSNGTNTIVSSSTTANSNTSSTSTIYAQSNLSTQQLEARSTYRIPSPIGCYVVKVVFENHNYSSITKVYKSIAINSNERTNSVIRKVLTKYGLPDEEPSTYVLLQSMDKKDVAIPDGSNVFYALNTSQPEINMIVRKK